MQQHIEWLRFEGILVPGDVLYIPRSASKNESKLSSAVVRQCGPVVSPQISALHLMGSGGDSEGYLLAVSRPLSATKASSLLGGTE